MHTFNNKKTPPSFTNMWITNQARNPQVILRNSVNLHVPNHHLESLKRLPLFTFPSIWNDDCIAKQNPNSKQYLRFLKNKLLDTLVYINLKINI